MTVLLRHSPSGYFYAGPGSWVSEPDQAVDLKTIENARDASRRETLGNLEILSSATAESCDWTDTMRRWQEADGRVQSV